MQIDAYERALEVTKKSGTDHRLVIQHCQTPREDQLERMGKLGIAASFFANHVWCAPPLCSAHRNSSASSLDSRGLKLQTGSSDRRQLGIE